MAYIHQISFDIDREHMGGLGVGSPLQRVLGFLRLELPNCEGFITSRAKYSLAHCSPDQTTMRVEVESVWEHYGDLKVHLDSGLAENKVLEEFQLPLEGLKTCEYAEMD